MNALLSVFIYPERNKNPAGFYSVALFIAAIPLKYSFRVCCPKPGSITSWQAGEILFINFIQATTFIRIAFTHCVAKPLSRSYQLIY